jgi:hypothetical protein
VALVPHLEKAADDDDGPACPKGFLVTQQY